MPGSAEYIYLFERVLYPICKEFNPDFVLVSSGFDSARKDPLGGIDVTAEGYAYMTTKLMKLAKGKVIRFF